MKRLRHLTAALLAGAVISYAVALLCMIPDGGTGPKGLTMEEEPPIFQITRVDTFGRSVARYWRLQFSGRNLSISPEDYEAHKFDFETIPAHLRPDSIGELDTNHVYVAAGWPMRSVACALDWMGNVPGPTTFSSTGAWVLADDKHGKPRSVPFRPRWIGLLVNTAIYASALTIVAWLARALRGRLRQRRGRCLDCGYDASGLDICPECGRSPLRPA